MQQGAATTVLLAASPLLDGISGRYFENCNEPKVVAARPTTLGRAGDLAAYAIDPGTLNDAGTRQPN